LRRHQKEKPGISFGGRGIPGISLSGDVVAAPENAQKSAIN
jgi:hypothetical protein